MPRDNAEIVRRAFEVFVQGDLETWLEMLDPAFAWDISTYPLPDVPDRGHGKEAAVKEFVGRYLAGWNDYSMELEEVREITEGEVLAVVHERATLHDSADPLERDLVQLWSVRDGRIAFLRVFKSKAEALQAGGPSD